MVVGILQITLDIPSAYSLKEKRKVVKSLIERTRHRFNVAVAEVADNDIYNRARIGMSAVANDAAVANSILDKALDALESAAAGRADVIDTQLELVHY
ncbi:MAG: DUF503 domain-containing protein [Myxococcota bacterium]